MVWAAWGLYKCLGAIESFCRLKRLARGYGKDDTPEIVIVTFEHEL